MKTHRRGFFAMIAGALAAPAVAKDIGLPMSAIKEWDRLHVNAGVFNGADFGGAPFHFADAEVARSLADFEKRYFGPASYDYTRAFDYYQKATAERFAALSQNCRIRPYLQRTFDPARLPA